MRRKYKKKRTVVGTYINFYYISDYIVVIK